jgi:hypothetical protein
LGLHVFAEMIVCRLSEQIDVVYLVAAHKRLHS